MGFDPVGVNASHAERRHKRKQHSKGANDTSTSDTLDSTTPTTPQEIADLAVSVVEGPASSVVRQIIVNYEERRRGGEKNNHASGGQGAAHSGQGAAYSGQDAANSELESDSRAQVKSLSTEAKESVRTSLPLSEAPPQLRLPMSSQGFPAIRLDSRGALLDVKRPASTFRFRFSPATFSAPRGSALVYSASLITADQPLPPWLRFNASVLTFTVLADEFRKGGVEVQDLVAKRVAFPFAVVNGSGWFMPVVVTAKAVGLGNVDWPGTRSSFALPIVQQQGDQEVPRLTSTTELRTRSTDIDQSLPDIKFKLSNGTLSSALAAFIPTGEKAASSPIRPLADTWLRVNGNRVVGTPGQSDAGWWRVQLIASNDENRGSGVQRNATGLPKDLSGWLGAGSSVITFDVHVGKGEEDTGSTSTNNQTMAAGTIALAVILIILAILLLLVILDFARHVQRRRSVLKREAQLQWLRAADYSNHSARLPPWWTFFGEYMRMNVRRCMCCRRSMSVKDAGKFTSRNSQKLPVTLTQRKEDPGTGVASRSAPSPSDTVVSDAPTASSSVHGQPRETSSDESVYNCEFHEIDLDDEDQYRFFTIHQQVSGENAAIEDLVSRRQASVGSALLPAQRVMSVGSGSGARQLAVTASVGKAFHFVYPAHMFTVAAGDDVNAAGDHCIQNSVTGGGSTRTSSSFVRMIEQTGSEDLQEAMFRRSDGGLTIAILVNYNTIFQGDMSMRQSANTHISYIERAESFSSVHDITAPGKAFLAHPPRRMSSVLPAALDASPFPRVARRGNTPAAHELRFVAFQCPNGEALPTWLHFNPKRCSFFGIPCTFDRGQWLVEVQAYRMEMAENGEPLAVLVKSALLLLEVV